MKTKWLSLLGGLLGVAVVLGGCKKDDIGEGTFFPAAQISFHVPDSIITASDIYLNPVSDQPEITIKVRSPQGINRATLVTYKNNGDPLDLEIIDQEVKTFTLFRDTIYFTIPAGTITRDDNSLIFEMQTEANHNALRTVRKGIIWHYGDGPVITFTDGITQLPAAFGTQEYELKYSITSDVGIASYGIRFIRGAFDDSDTTKFTYFGEAFNEYPDDIRLKRNFSGNIPINESFASATGVEISATDVLPGTEARKTTVRIFRAPVAAPTFESVPENLPADFADGAYLLTGSVKSDGGLVGIKLELLAGTYGSNGLPEITGTTPDAATTTFLDPTNFDLTRNISADRTTGHFGIRITAIDRFLQVVVKDIFTPAPLVVPPPAIEVYGTFLPSTLAVAGYTLEGIVTSEAGLSKVQFDILTGTFDGNTANVTGFETAITITSFSDQNEYLFNIPLSAIAGAVGIKVIATDLAGKSTEYIIYAVPTSSIVVTKYTGCEVRGWRNRNSQIFVYSLTVQSGCTLNDADNNTNPPVNKPSTVALNINSTDYTYGQLADFSFVSKQGDLLTPEKYELWTPASASLGGYMTATLPEWATKNSTWFGLIGKVRSPENPKGIVWEDLQGYNEIISSIDFPNAPGDPAWPAAFRYTENGGVHVGDIFAFKTDPAKPYGGGKVGVLLVTGFRYAGDPPTRYDDTRLQFEFVIQSPE